MFSGEDFYAIINISHAKIAAEAATARACGARGYGLIQRKAPLRTYIYERRKKEYRARTCPSGGKRHERLYQRRTQHYRHEGM